MVIRLLLSWTNTTRNTTPSLSLRHNSGAFRILARFPANLLLRVRIALAPLVCNAEYVLQYIVFNHIYIVYAYL